MGIRTELTEQDLRAVAAEWGLPGLTAFRGLPEGSINTLYVLESGVERWVLRLSEGRSRPEVAFETELLAYLEVNRYPAVRLVRRPDGALFGEARGRFACIFRWAAGESPRGGSLTPERALESGRALGRLHAVGEAFPRTLPNRYAPAVISRWVDELVDESRRADRPEDPELWDAIPLLESEAARLASLPPAPEGIVHADWFLDNLRFVGDRLSAVLDFEMACRGPLVLDLAVAIHAGCFAADFVPGRVRALVEGYVSERPLGVAERALFHDWARFAALRFTVSRIRDFHRSELPEGQLLRKDWRRFRDRLRRTVELGRSGWLELCGLD